MIRSPVDTVSSVSPFSSSGWSHISGRLEGDHLLIPLVEPTVPLIVDQIEIAASLARATDAVITVLVPITIPNQTPLTYGPEVPGNAERKFLDWALHMIDEHDLQSDTVFSGRRQTVPSIRQAITNHQVDTVVLPPQPRTQLRHPLAARIAALTDCDVIVVNGEPGYEEAPSILLAVAGGPHSGLAADVAHRLAADANAWIDILHVVPEDAAESQRELGQEYLEAAYNRIGQSDRVSTWLLEATDTADAIIDQSQYYNLVVIGAPTTSRLRTLVHGSTNRTIRAEASSVVLSVRNNS